jgi:hypothetical protein
MSPISGLLLVACSGALDDAAAAKDDATCAPSGTPFDALHGCAPAVRGDRLDLDERCVDGVCLGQTLAAADAAYGAAASCVGSDGDAWCFWGDGVVGMLLDDDENGVPDPGAHLWLLQALGPWDGTDPSGLALGLGLGCFVDALGTPDSLAFVAVDGALVPHAATWSARDLTVNDAQTGDDAYVPDGEVESIVFTDAGYR